MAKKWLPLILAAVLTLSLLPAASWGEEDVKQLNILYGASGFTLPVEENPIRDAIREATGIDMKMEAWYYGSDDEYNTQLNLWAASGDLPFDIFLGGGGTFATSMWNMMGEAGMIRELESWISSSEAMTAFCAHTFPKYRNKNDGKVYMYPFHLNKASDYGSLRDAGVSVRIDWMRELGLENPTNPAEYYDMLVKMKDAYGVTPFSTAEGDVTKLAINFVGQYGTSLWEQDAEGTYRIVMFNRYDALTDFAVFLNKMWNEGLMDQESFTQKSEQLTEKLTAGKAGSCSSLRHSTQATINDILWAEDEDALLAYIPSFANEGIIPVNMGVNNWGGSTCVVNSNMSDEKMKTLVDLWEWLLTKEGTVMTFMGVEGVHWTYNDEGLCEFLQEFIAQYPTENERQEYGLWHYQAPAASWFRIDQYAAEKPEYARKDYTYSMASCNDTVELTDITYAITAGEEEQLRLPSINDAWKQTLVKAVMARTEEECRSIIEGFKDTLNSLGYDVVCEERTRLTAELGA